MPIPSYETFMLPVLRLFGEGAQNVKECLPRLMAEFNISDEEAALLIPSGRLTVLQSRAHWARTYLGKAGLLESPKRNLHVITPRGREVLASPPTQLDLGFLEGFEGFKEWRARTATDVTGEPNATIASVENPTLRAQVEPTQTPEDAIAQAHQILNAALRDELWTCPGFVPVF